jgi:2-iminobutanoate/2-iminopropanoate deaminase
MEYRLPIILKLAMAALLALGAAGCATGPAREVITTGDAPAAIGPYSQAVRFGNFLFLSGQIPIDPRTNRVNTGSIEEQTAQVLKNIEVVLAANGMALKDVLSVPVFLKDLSDFAGMNAVYGTYFKENPPARTTVEVENLPRDVLLEITAIAAKQ